MDIFQKLLQIEDETGGDVSNLRNLINSGQLTTASEINRPNPKQSVKEIELFNEFNLRNPRADGGRMGFKKGSREDLEFENITRLENAKINQVPTRNASAFRALPGYDNITYTDFRNKETGEIIRKYNVRVRVQDKNVQKIGTTADKYKNIDTLEEALELRDQFRLDNPKNIKPLDKEKQKITKDTRRADIKARGGVEDFLVAEEGSGVQKGHAQNIKNPDVKIKPSNIIYTPTAINEAMAGKGDTKALDLDFKIREAENKIKKIKNSRASAGAKKKLLAEQDNLLMKYVAQSDGFKTVTLSDGNVYGEIFQKAKSMDMLDEFPNMTEKEVKTFVRQYITEKGDLKPFYKRKVKEGTLSDVDKANIQKSKIFLENVELAKQNAKQKVKGLLPFMKKLGIKCQLSNGTNCMNPRAYEKSLNQISKAAQAGDSAAQSKLLNFRNAVKGAGSVIKGVLGPAAIAAEIGIAIPIGLFDYAQGKPTEEIVNTLTYGLAGKSREDRLKEEMPAYGQGDELQKAFDSYLSSLNKLGMPRDPNQLRPGKKTDDMLKTFRERQEPFMRVNPQLEEGRFFDLDMFDKNVAESRAIEEKLAKEDLERQEKRKTPFDLSDPFQAAGGGIAKEAGDSSGPPPESGPDSQGLPGILKRAKKI